MTKIFDDAKEVKMDYSRLRVPFGPVHPALKEPISFTLVVRKEEILDVDIRIGHVHRGIEALAESRNLVQALYLVERICGICSHSQATCFVQAIEEIGEIKPSERALYLRTLVFELERIHSHLLVLGLMAYEVGFDTLFMFSWHVREGVLDLFEQITGNRVHHSMNTLGGVRWDLASQHIEKLKSTVTNMEKSIKRISEIFHDKTIEKRLCKVAILGSDKARELCVVGPTARGSGVNRDTRKERPYAAYDKLKDSFSVVLRNNADAYARTEVRILELFESINIMRKILDQLPNGSISVEKNVLKLMKNVPEGETISTVEAPRGELLHFVKTNGKEGLWRLSVRTPTLANVLSLKPMLVGHEIADVPVAIASIDLCLSCANRIEVVDQSRKETRIMNLEVFKRKVMKK